MDLLLEMTLSDVKKVFKDSISEELWGKIEDLLTQSENNLVEKYPTNKTWPLKYPLLLKALSLLKKEPEEIVLRTLKPLIPILYDMSFIMAHSNLTNNMEPSMKKWFLDYMKLKNIINLSQWTYEANNYTVALNEIIQDKLLGDEKVEPLYTGDGFKIYKITNHVMARKIGGDTSWCVSSPTSGKKYCNEYLEERKSELYALVFNESKEKYLLAIWPNPEFKKYEYTDLIETLQNLDDISLITEELCKGMLKRVMEYHDIYMNSAIKKIYDKIMNKEITTIQFLNSMIEGMIKYKNFVNDLKTYLNPPTIKLYDPLQSLQAQGILYAIETNFNITFKDIQLPLWHLMNAFFYQNLTEKLSDFVKNELEKKYGISPFKLSTFIMRKSVVLLSQLYELKDRNDDELTIKEAKRILSYYLNVPGKARDFATEFLGVADVFTKADEIFKIMRVIPILNDPKKYSSYGVSLVKKIKELEELDITEFMDHPIINAINNIRDLGIDIWKELIYYLRNKLEKHFRASILEAGLLDNPKILESITPDRFPDNDDRQYKLVMVFLATFYDMVMERK